MRGIAEKLHKIRKAMIAVVPAAVLLLAAKAFPAAVTGELMKWHRVAVSFEGPEVSETDGENPFTSYRLNVTFSNGDREHVVPGFFAADGDAAESGADSGSVWRVYFSPDATGEWTYKASFRKGENVAIADDPMAGEAAAFDGETGSFEVEPSDKTGRDARAKGLLRYVGGHFLQFAETGEYYLKAGADSPENFLGYYEFDQTRYGGDSPEKDSEGEADPNLRLHRYEPHVRDWTPGNPAWRGGKGKGIVGALNYLASKGMNCVYFLTMNVGGDGKDVWPWTGYEERHRFDVSKLDQWEIVFSHMDGLGLLLHVITQETENDQLLDGGDLGEQRKLYYRELIARFAHHPALMWNLGEENTNTSEQIRAFSQYIHNVDPYDHPIVVHTYPGQYDKVYEPHLGENTLQGLSLQMGDMGLTHEETVKWVTRSRESGHPWAVFLDEIGPANVGVLPDELDYWHDEVRMKPLWGNLMGGGSGCEWYFGYQFPHNDLNCEDWRSRDHLWDLTRHAVEFFQNHLPFNEMVPADGLTSSRDDYCLAKEGEVYAVYLPFGMSTRLRAEEGRYSVRWYDPRNGGPLQEGTVKEIEGGGDRGAGIGYPPSHIAEDWVALIRRVNN